MPGEVKGEVFKFKVFGEAVSLSSNASPCPVLGRLGLGDVRRRGDLPNEGNAAVRGLCIERSDDGLGTSIKAVPVHQGFSVRDMQLRKTAVIAKTGGDFKDFVYWNFSGRAPGIGGGEEGSDDIEEPARWRTATFGAVSAHGVPSMSAFKARSGDGSDGIFLRKVLPTKAGEVMPLLWTGMPGVTVDPRRRMAQSSRHWE